MKASHSKLLSVEVWRGTEQGSFETFEVPRRDRQTVLDVVTWLQRHEAPALAYRFACRVGMCGSCAMTVNGQPRWTCRTLVDEVVESGQLRLEPLRHFPVIKDLVVDMAELFARWSKTTGNFESALSRRDAMPGVSPDSPMRAAADAAIECINCGVCHAACEVVGWDREYLGPAVLNRLWTLVNDERHTARATSLNRAISRGGCTSCHSQGRCTRACPVGLDPSRSVAGLKRLGLKAYLAGDLR